MLDIGKFEYSNIVLVVWKESVEFFSLLVVFWISRQSYNRK